MFLFMGVKVDDVCDSHVTESQLPVDELAQHDDDIPGS
jgi:hypothetical protein